MSASAALRRLSSWPELWRHPRLFACVHGAGGVAPHDLLTALLAQEVEDPMDAWRSIIDEGDLAAAEAAYQQIGPAVGIHAARRDLEKVRAAFLRRVDVLRDRARVLTSGRTATETALDEARRIYLTHPHAAERLLVVAAATAEAAEHEQLEHLRRVHLQGGDDGRRRALADAISAGDLRCALIFAGRLEQAVEPIQPLAHEVRLERQPTSRLIRWRLEPDLAPAWLPRVDVAEHDVALLVRLQALQGATAVDFIEADHFTRVALKFLAAGKDWHVEIARGRARSPDTWSVLVRGGGVAELFPHAVDEEGEVELVFPRSPAAHWPGGQESGRFVGCDLFELWRLSSRTDALIATPRMFLDLLGMPSGRASEFVRLQSRQIAVRQLILHVLGRDLGQAFRLARTDTAAGLPISATELLTPLLEALDLYVDEGDVLAITDACGDRLEWLLPVLHAAARASDNAPPSHRRFDALNLLRQPVVERELEAMYKANLESLLPDTVQSCLVLDTAEDLFELHAGDGEAGIQRGELAEAIVRRGYATSVVDAEAEIDNHLRLGLLRSVAAVGSTEDSRLILKSLPLPARVLLGS